MSAPVLLAIGALAVYAARRAGAPASTAAVAPAATGADATSHDSGGAIVSATAVDGVLTGTASEQQAMEGKPVAAVVSPKVAALRGETISQTITTPVASTDLPTIEAPAETPSGGPKGAIGGSLADPKPTAPPRFARTPYATARLIEDVGPSLGMIW